MKHAIYRSAPPILGVALLLLVLFLLRHPTVAAPGAPQADCTPIGTARTYADGVTVTLCGRATMYTGGFYAGGGEKFYIQDDTGGMQVYSPDPAMPDVTLGDWVVVTGTMGTYRNERQIQPSTVPDDVDVTDGTPADVPAPRSTDLDEIGEESEGRLVQIRGRATRIEEFTYNWEMNLTDGRTTVLVYVDKNTGIDLTGYPLGYTYLITGISAQYDDKYEVKPRLQSDIRVLPSLLIEKEAPMLVGPGGLLTYTITVSNYTQMDLSNLVVTDRVPSANATPARILDGGTLVGGNTISWTRAVLTDGAAAAFRFVVTATDAVGAVISNTAYAAWAAEWPTHEVGSPIYTVVSDRDYLPVYRIQGDGFRSPYAGVRVRTAGVVIGFFEGNYPGSGSFDGFFIQDASGDGITTTSDGLFVHHGSLPVSVSVGDRVVVTGTVEEFSEWEGTSCSGDDCLTQIVVDGADDIAVVGTDTVSPVSLDPPGDPDDAAVYWESLEGMRVTLPVTGVVVGPTSYGTVMVVPGDEGITRAMRGGPYEGMPVGVRHWERYGSINGADPPNLIVGSVVTSVDGPLMFSYGSYLVATQAGEPWTAVLTAPEPASPPSWPTPGPDEFTVMSFNVENFFDTTDDPGKNDPVPSEAEYQVHRNKVVSTVVRAGCPTFVAVQEVEKQAVLEDVAALLATHGCTYTAVLSEGLDGRGIDVGFLVEAGRVVVEGVRQYQDCTTYDTGLGQGDCPAGQQRLFSRLPLVLTATVDLEHGDVPVLLIANHLKSKRSREGDPESAQWRLLQAQSLAEEVARIRAAHPHRLPILLGDLNDFEDSPPLEALYITGSLTNTWYVLPAEERYSYIYHGVSQILDHILVPSSGLVGLEVMGPLHYNADFPYKPYHDDDGVIWRTSDHDPIMATFRRRFVYLPLVLRAGP